VLRLLVAASVVSSSPILVTRMKEALSSSETSVLTRTTRRKTPFFKSNSVFRDIMPCSPVARQLTFRSVLSPPSSGLKISICLLPDSRWIFSWLIRPTVSVVK
jgi:hypothetical protein